MVARNPIQPPGDDWFIAPIVSYPHGELPDSDFPPFALDDEVHVYFKPDDDSEEGKKP